MEKFMKKDPQALYLSGLISEEQFYYSQSKNESWDAETQKYLDWHKQFTAKFPVGEYNRSNDRDRDSLFAGRITWVLDEIGGGEHEKIWQYISGVHSAEGNYYKLLTKLVERDHPEMLAQWMDDGYGDRGTR
jgi:hypothetical protein